MAVNKVIEGTTLSIEIQNGTDKAGLPTYTKKTFSGIKDGVDVQNIFDVAEAIKAVLNAKTRNSLINETSSISQA